MKIEKEIFWNKHNVEKDLQIKEYTMQGKTPYGCKIPKEKLSLVRRHFNVVADRYDLMNTLLSFGIHYYWKRIAVKALDLKKGDIVLDLCGGTGDLSVLVSKKVGAAGKVLLYDINLLMIKKGILRNVSSSARPNIYHIKGDAERVSFHENSFDAAVVGFGIRNLTYPEAGFREMHRVLKPGGKMVCLEFSQPTIPLFRHVYDLYSFYLMPLLGGLIVGSKSAYSYLTESIRMFPSPMELAEIMRRAGFGNIKYRRLTNGIAVVHRGVKQ
ncbi:MAG: class I SAM-dependent methyltransferase [Deltaproteobacteria bacterium]|nr:class I SAM-dependent methyltransferase [Deltaproteobacteria bacterium]